MASAPRSQASDASLGLALRLGLFGLALTALWVPLNSLVLADLVSGTVRGGVRGSALGLLSLIGIGTAVVVQPIAGAISDHARLSDRRRPFILTSALVMAPLIFLLWFAPSFWWLAAAYVALQCASNVAQAAYQALVPDLVPEDGQETASGAKTGLNLVGNLLGLGGAGMLVAAGFANLAILLFLGGVILLGAVAVWLLVPPVPPLDKPNPLGPPLLGEAFKPLFTAPSEFKLAVLTRFLFLLGLYPVQRFLVFYLEDRFEVDDPISRGAWVFLAAIALGAGSAALAGLLANSKTRRPWTVVSILISAGALFGVAWLPWLPMVAIAGTFLAIGSGAFQTLNWATLTRTVPDGEGARYLGVANIATAGASAVAGLLGPLVDVGQRWLPAATYQITFSVAAVIALLALLPERRPLSGAKRGTREKRFAPRATESEGRG